jgi:transposase
MTKGHQDVPRVVDKNETEVAEIIRLIQESALSDSVKDFVVGCIESALWLPRILQKKNISLNRLKKILFGKGYGRHKKQKSAEGDLNTSVVPDKKAQNDVALAPELKEEKAQDALGPPSTPVDTPTQQKIKGHGRMSHNVYQEFTEGHLSLGLQAGDSCPFGCGGKLCWHRPGIIVRVFGRNMADVYKYQIEKLRCALCGALVKAEVPPAIGDEKYHASFKSLMVLQKYYVAIPFYRQEYFQRLIGFPLPDATQWDLCEQVGGCCYPIFSILKELSANGKRIYNDDTKLKILEVIQEIKNLPDPDRTGMFTTGIISENAGRQIALFLNGTQHAGENLDDILEKRDPQSPPIIQMCDALSCNVPKRFATILCNCLSHGFRKFEELVDFFPKECIPILEKLARVYEHDEKTQGMTDEGRLAYHQQHSGPILEVLYESITASLDDHLVEPNSELGKAILYLIKHRPKLTRFLSVPGAPLDSNIVERALKIAIRNRKAAMFYRTRYSASIGGMLTSVIYTCHLAHENAFHYLTALQQHQKEVLASPKAWLPWNYQETLQKITPGVFLTGANQPGCGPPRDYLVAA